MDLVENSSLNSFFVSFMIFFSEIMIIERVIHLKSYLLPFQYLPIIREN